MQFILNLLLAMDRARPAPVVGRLKSTFICEYKNPCYQLRPNQADLR